MLCRQDGRLWGLPFSSQTSLVTRFLRKKHQEEGRGRGPDREGVGHERDSAGPRGRPWGSPILWHLLVRCTGRAPHAWEAPSRDPSGQPAMGSGQTWRGAGRRGRVSGQAWRKQAQGEEQVQGPEPGSQEPRGRGRGSVFLS